MHYRNAPIREAVFDIKIDKLGVASVDDLKSIKSSLPTEFEIEKTHINFSGEFKFGLGVSPEGKAHSSPAGFIYSNRSNSKKVQFRLDGFTLNVLKPYDRWEVHFPEFMKLWELYYTTFRPSKVIRIGLRFINRIEIPMPLSDFDDYLTVSPRVPSALPQLIAGFFTQIRVPSHDPMKVVLINQTMEPTTDTLCPLILDIDVYQSDELNFENIGKNFEIMRTIKNEVFESCITSNARKLFV